MSLLAFLLQAGVISLSGVMAPGPMTAVTVSRGADSPHAGALVAIGHGVVEFPLMAGIYFGLGALFEVASVQATIALIGGAFLIYSAIGMLRQAAQPVATASNSQHSPLVAGILLSLGNPYFLIWWASVGATLILRAVAFGTLGFVVFALLHWLCDFLWSYFLSALSFQGGRFFGRTFQRVVFAVSGVLLVVFGAIYLIDAARMLV